MSKLELSEQDLKALEKALNGSQAPPQELAKKAVSLPRTSR
jgi:hypothetical protein